MNKKILIFPDVHGRTFWESALKSGDYEKIVFLGDHLFYKLILVFLIYYL